VLTEWLGVVKLAGWISCLPIIPNDPVQREWRDVDRPVSSLGLDFRSARPSRGQVKAFGELLLQFGELIRQVLVTVRDRPHADKGAHHKNAHPDCRRAFEHVGGHHSAVFGEGVRELFDILPPDNEDQRLDPIKPVAFLFHRISFVAKAKKPQSRADDA